MTSPTTKLKIPSDLKEKRVLPVLLWRKDSENLWLIEQADKAKGAKPRSQALILRDLAEAEVKRLELRE